MKKGIARFLLGLLIISQTFSIYPGVLDTNAEDSDNPVTEAGLPDLSLLPALPYDFRGDYRETYYLKNRVAFRNTDGEYVAFDFMENGNVGLVSLYQDKSVWRLPSDFLVYAKFDVYDSYAAYRYINGEWIVQSHDRNSWYYVDLNRVIDPEIGLIFSSVDLRNKIGTIYSGKIDGFLENASFNDVLEGLNGHYGSQPRYGFALPIGANSSARYDGVVLGKTSSSPDYVCQDGLDNDGDGASDAADSSCHTDWDIENILSYNPRIRSESEDNLKRLPVRSDGTEIANGSSSVSFSANGKLMTFVAETNSGRNMYNNRADVFIYDATTGVMEDISLAIGGGSANANSARSSISDDGNLVTFESSASNLSEDDMNGKEDIYLYDRRDATLTLVSRGLDGKSAAGHSYKSLIGGKGGRFILFQSEAPNLVPDDNNGQNDIFIYDIITGGIRCISMDSNGNSLKNNLYHPAAISSDSDYVAFASGYDILIYNLRTIVTERINIGSIVSDINISPDGNFITFHTGENGLVPGDNNSLNDAFVYNRAQATFERVNISMAGQSGNEDLYEVFASAEGRYISFTSYVNNLVEGDNNNNADVFIVDQKTNEIRRLSITNEGEEANGGSMVIDITPDGKYVLISSGASNLVVGDVNETTDAFIVKNPFFIEDVPPANPPVSEDMIPALTGLKQVNESDGAEVGIGKIVNEGADNSADSIFLSARVESPDGHKVAMEIQLEKLDEVSGIWGGFKPMKSAYVSSGEIATLDYMPAGGVYAWKARAVDETGKESAWEYFGDNGAEADFISSNFSFVFMTDVHLGSLTTVAATIVGQNWYESQSYPRFTDVLYEIENLDPRPDFILIGGDNVEYNDKRWLEDFRSITDGFTEKTGIEIYFVPGNHDRYDSESSAFQWGQTNFSGGNDDLEEYFYVIADKPDGVTSLFEDDGEIMDAKKSRANGYNKYNYYFNHDGIQFIGLDSGKDIETDDWEPEGDGIGDMAMARLYALAEENGTMPKILFMHHPVYDGGKDPSYNEKYGKYMGAKLPSTTDTGELAENESFVNNWDRFIRYCDDYDVALVLAGHTHDSGAYSLSGAEDLSNWTNDKDYPLFVQTQSATKEDEHGYRMVEVRNGKAIPQEPRRDITKYEKVYTDLDGDESLGYESYTSSGEKMALEAAGDFVVFVADGSGKKVIYEDTAYSRFEIFNQGLAGSTYDFFMQKREEGVEPPKQPERVFGYYIQNPEFCGDLGLDCSSLIATMDHGGYKDIYLKHVGIGGGTADTIAVNWDMVGTSNPLAIAEGISFSAEGNPETRYIPLPFVIAVELNSPGELRVYDGDKVTGMVDGEIVEDIPYSLYIPESDTIYLFRSSMADFADLRIRVYGSYEAAYDLAVSLSENNETRASFAADDILIDDQTIHQFRLDWEALSRGENGVKMEWDGNKDGEFEKMLISDGILSSPEAVLAAAKYETKEGAQIVFDASGSFDADDSIALYEWDFDGDGAYDAASQRPTMAHSYGDDFSGKVFVKVTDDEGLSDLGSISSAEVSVTNLEPTATISRFEIADTFDEFILQGDFTDAGWLDTHVVVIDWGDGDTDNISVLQEEHAYPDASGMFRAAHRYARFDNHTVRLTVTDDDGGRVVSEISLGSPRHIRRAALSKLQAVRTDHKDALKELRQAIISLEDSLADRYWQDDFHVSSGSMNKFFSLDQKAVKSLEKTISGGKKYADFQPVHEIQEILAELNRSNVFLAKIMVYEAGSWDAKDLRSAKSWVEKLLGAGIKQRNSR